MSEVQENTIECPDCGGSGNHVYPTVHEKYPLCGPVFGIRWCDRCKSSGRVPQEMQSWIENGKRIRERRIAQRRTLLDVAQEWNSSVSFVSSCERGVVDNSAFVNREVS
jgi:hypothetical protein